MLTNFKVGEIRFIENKARSGDRALSRRRPMGFGGGASNAQRFYNFFPKNTHILGIYSLV